MDWFHNPIADMYGPHFLMVYALASLAAIATVWALRRAADGTGGLPPP